MISLIFVIWIISFSDNVGGDQNVSRKRPNPDPQPCPTPVKVQKTETVDYSSASPATKDRKVKKLVKDNHPDAIIRAAIKALKDQGHSNASEALRLIHSDPDDLNSVRSFLNKIHKGKGKLPSIITPSEALNFVCELGLSKNQYTKTVALGNPDCIDQDIWPKQCQLGKERAELRPSIDVTEYDVICPMEGLVHKTLERLLLDPDLKVQIKRLVELNGGPLKMTFIFKYGLDGSKVGCTRDAKK